MTVTTPASPTETQARLKAAVACLNLSLEAELTQYRCHRLVQSLSPFPSAAVPTAKPTPVTAPTAAQTPLPQLPAATPVAEIKAPPVALEPISEPVIEAALSSELPVTASVPTLKQPTISSSPASAPEENAIPESVMELLAELDAQSSPASPTTESVTTPLQAWFAPIFPKDPPAPVTPDSMTAEAPPGLDEELPPVPDIADLFPQTSTTPIAAGSKLSPSANLTSEPVTPETAFSSGLDEVWFDLGDFQAFPREEATDPQPQSNPTSPSPLSPPTFKQPDSPNTYFDSAAALLENIPDLDSPTPAKSSSFLTRGLRIGVVLAGLVTAAGVWGYLWWQMGQESKPIISQQDSLDAPPGLGNTNSLPLPPVTLPPTQPMPPSPTAVLASPPPTDAVTAAPKTTTTSTAVIPSPAPAILSSPSPSNLVAPPVSATPTPAQAVASSAVEPLAAPMGVESFFYVIAPYHTPQDLVKARQGIANAYLVQFPEGVRIQFAAFEDAISAQTLVNSLAQQGIKSEVRAPKP